MPGLLLAGLLRSGVYRPLPGWARFGCGWQRPALAGGLLLWRPRHASTGSACKPAGAARADGLVAGVIVAAMLVYGGVLALVGCCGQFLVRRA
jgi:hypothetical protein